jgi:hypothetical protein
MQSSNFKPALAELYSNKEKVVSMALYSGGF